METIYGGGVEQKQIHLDSQVSAHTTGWSPPIWRVCGQPWLLWPQKASKAVPEEMGLGQGHSGPTAPSTHRDPDPK